MEKTMAPISERINVQRDFINHVAGTLMAKEVGRIDNRKFAKASHYDYLVHAFETFDKAKAQLLKIGAETDEK
ncbi:hypothetical protein KOM07_03290 [Lentilactobacillus sp. G22-6]|uniref:hypothetical protein n=1 Tax=Lentilactobacillus dabitei TaxID=2831523 RepID=UPI001C26CFE0|nr:hypothetical protein [Lentilactobacillus dabitei]MBU9788585.1 hypothetical protein [Lentilactobacillus dabitei]